jgi:hypothetical protein
MTVQFQTRGSIAAALAAALTLTSLNLAPAQAAAAKGIDQLQETQSTAATTDFSARRRHYRRGNAAALGAFIGVFGTIAAIAAANQYRDDYYYYGDPYYGGYGYGPSFGYAPRYGFRHGGGGWGGGGVVGGGHHHHHR